MPIRVLEGFTVGVTAESRCEDQAALLRRRGAVVRHGPTVECVAASSSAALRRATLEFIHHPPELLLVTTSSGFRMWLAAAQRWGLLERLTAAMSAVRVAARGAKASQAVYAAELSVWWSTPETLESLLELVLAEPLSGRRVAIQSHGGDMHGAVERLTGAGAEVTELQLYQLRLPRNRTAAYSLIEAACERRLDVLTFTTASSVRNMFELAEQRGAGAHLRDACNRDLVFACVGPTSARAARDLGVLVPLIPPRAQLGSMVQAISERLQPRRRWITVAGNRLAFQGSLVVIGDEHVVLSSLERAVLDALIRRPGSVVGRAALLREVWGSATTNPHRVDTTISRLRQRLGPIGSAIQVIERRGFRLVAEPEWSDPLSATQCTTAPNGG